MPIPFKNGDKVFIKKVPPDVASFDPVMRIKGIPCPYVDVEGEEISELSSWVLIKNDLGKAKNPLDLMLEKSMKEESQISEVGKTNHIVYKAGDDLDSILIQSLFTSAIITYCKLFTEARGRTVKLNANKIFQGYPKSKIKTHNEIRRLRNKYIAHGDKSEHENVLVRIALSPNLTEKEVIKTYYMVQSTSGLPATTIREYIDVLSIVSEHVENEITQCFDKIRREVGGIPIEKLYEHATYLDPESVM